MSNQTNSIMNNNDVDQFSFYLDTLNLKMDNDVLLLTSQYYYDLNEIKHINTIIHIKELNQVKDLQRLLSNLMKSLSNGTKFVGCFVDNNIYNRGRIGYWLLQFTDPDNNRYISRKRMTKMFMKYGLQVIDMTDINGVTYFCIKKH